MMPEPGDIWQFHHPYRDEQDSIVLIHEFLCTTHNLSQKKALIYLGYDMLTDQYDEFIFSEDTLGKCWRKLG